MRLDSGKRIWEGYDGTIFTNNFTDLTWKKCKVDFEELQILPKSRRYFGSMLTPKLSAEKTQKGLENLALNKPAQQSSFSRWSKPNDSQGAVNGIKSGQFGFCTNQEVNPWWQVDLLDVYQLTEVRVYNRITCAERARTLKVLLSCDGENWEEVYANDEQSVFGGMDGNPLMISLPSKVSRYVRLQLNEENYLHLDEIEVYGT